MAGKVRRIDWSPSEWLSGTRGLLSERELAVYDVVLNTIYDRGDACPDDAAFITGHFRRDSKRSAARHVQLTRAALDHLISIGKLKVTTDYRGRWLTNGRADIELGRAQGRIDSASRAGVASGAARRSTRLRLGSDLATPRLKSKASNSKGLTRTVVHNHQPPESSSSTTESVAARATVRVSGALPAARPTQKLDPRLAKAAEAARAKLMKGSA